MVSALCVALRKESVDRNFAHKKNRPSVGSVALRKESVDRNDTAAYIYAAPHQSLSARRAWIEMLIFALWMVANHLVALRKESVDRNAFKPPGKVACQVALRKESVDRNSLRVTITVPSLSRSPQGERG